MSLHGPRFILLEFGIGTPALAAFGLLMILRGSLPLGAYFLSLGANYVPLLLHAIAARQRFAHRVELDRDEKKRYVRRYGLQQWFIVVPFGIAIIALAQWWERRD